MKELSLNILDIAMNSVKADASNIGIHITETDTELKVIIEDDGFGMSEETLSKVCDPFCTTRTTRRVGLGIPFYKLAAEQTGGNISITSKVREDFPDSCGTVVIAVFNKKHIDCLPLGDIVSTVCTLIQGSPNVDFEFTHNSVSLSTKQLREVLGPVPLSSPEVLVWIKEYLSEQYKELYKQKEGELL